jgi:hypothetical protein
MRVTFKIYDHENFLKFTSIDESCEDIEFIPLLDFEYSPDDMHL